MTSAKMTSVESASFRLERLLRLLLVLSMPLQLTGASTSRGTEFVVFFPKAHKDRANSLYVTTDSVEDATVKVIIQDEVNVTETVSRSLPVWIPLPEGMAMDAEGLSFDFTILVTASRPVSLFAEFAKNRFGGCTLVLPTSELGRRYVVATYVPRQMAWVGLVATQDDTAVELHRNGTLLISRPLFMQSLEALLLEANHDLTGMEVVADKPVAVFSGNSKTTTVHAHSTYDHLYSQMVPTISWGTSFITFPTLTSGTNDTDKYRIVASEANTTVHVTGKKSIYLIKPTDWFQVNLSAHGVFAITSNRPVMVVKFVGGSNVLSQPCMTSLVPNDRWLTSYAYRVTSTLSQSVIWIVGYSGTHSNIRVQETSNSTPMPFGCNYQVADQREQDFEVCRLEVGSAISLQLTSVPSVKFAAYSFSYDNRTSTCLTLGLELTRDSVSGEVEQKSSSLETTEKSTLAVTSDESLPSTVATTRTSADLETGSFTSALITDESTETSQGSTQASASETPLESSIAPTQTPPDTSGVSMAPVSTAAPLQSSTASTPSSTCSCRLQCSFRSTPTRTELEVSSAVERIQSELVVNYRQLSVRRRKVTCAPDQRQGSRVVGYMGIGFITLAISWIVIPDLLNLMRYIVQGWKQRYH